MKYLVLFFMFITLCYKTKISLHMLQQNLYNENNRYIKWLLKNMNVFLGAELVIIPLIAIYNIYPKIILYIMYIVLSIMYIFVAIKNINAIKNSQQKKPLVVTKRIKRLICTIVIVYMIPIILFIFNIIGFKYLLLIESIMVYLNFVVVGLCCLINYPVERCVYYYYKNKAVSKLKSMENLKVVGITGSYGKTSSKNILNDILSIKYNVLPSPLNYNTHYGLMITINNYMDKFTDIFIAEMGAYVKGEIKGMCNLVHPKYGILTNIGTAHLESFGSEENIQKGKFELIESLPEDGIGVLNRDDPKQVNYDVKTKAKLLWIGIDNIDVDVRAVDIKTNYKGTKFKVVFKGDKTKYEFETKLLGKHSIYNILAGIALGREFGISIEDLQKSVKGVRAVEHRLELKKLGNFYMIDDAYNSNPIGAKSALDVLGMMPGIKVVVTPGMIELADKEDELNEIFGTQIAEVADYAILIGEKKTKPIYKGLIKAGYDKDNIIIYNNVKEAYGFINTLTGDKEVYALFENDLPDTYSE